MFATQPGKLRQIPAVVCVALAVVTLALWITSPDPLGNRASLESQRLAASLAPRDQATTLAQVRREDGMVATLWVVAISGDSLDAVDVSAATGSTDHNPLRVWRSVTPQQRIDLLQDTEEHRTYAVSQLLSVAPDGNRHIGTGTNFPEHAEEALSTSVFQFPKFGTARGPRSNVYWRDDVLLDYEVEMCIRFDRAIRSLDDFDAALKGVFLCGDFTDRSALVRLVDPDNLDSGRGFSDGKSRADFFPAGALLVVPNDVDSFVGAERMITEVNGIPRQDARGGEMTLTFRQLTEKALADMTADRFLYQGEFYTLAPDAHVDTSMALMSGTAEGVIFTPPSRGDLIEGVIDWVISGAMLKAEPLIAHVIEVFISNELASGHFLQPGDTVVHRASHLGDIVVDVIERPDD